MAYPVIPVFLKDVLKAQPLFIGLIEAIAESTASIIKAFSGYLSDFFRKRKLFICVGYALSAAVKPLLAFAAHGWHVLLVRFGDRLGKGIRTAPRDALIADSTAEKSFGRAYGFHRAMDTLGALLGPLCAFIILAIWTNNYRLLFGLAFIPGFIAVLLTITGVKEIIPEIAKRSRFSFKNLTIQFKLFLLVMVIFTLGNSSDAFLILRARDVGVTAGAIPLLWLTFNLSYFLWSYPAGVISDHIGRVPTICFGFVIFAIVYGSLAFNQNPFLVWMIFIIYGLYYGFTEGNFRAYVADVIPKDIRATAFGMYHTVVGISLLPANLLMGLLWQKVGFKYALLVGTTCSLIAGILLLIFSYGFKRIA
jgi:MFS family permease